MPPCLSEPPVLMHGLAWIRTHTPYRGPIGTLDHPLLLARVRVRGSMAYMIGS